MLDKRLYEIKYSNGHQLMLTANTIVSCTFAQIDDEENCNLVFNNIIDHCIADKEVKKADAFIYSKNRAKYKVETTVGHKVLLQ